MLISLLPLDVVEDLPHQEPEPDPENELQGIEMVGEIGSGADRKGLCRIGAATTNEMFREWVEQSYRAVAPKTLAKKQD